MLAIVSYRHKLTDMAIPGESYLDTTVTHEINKPTIDLTTLPVGSEVSLVFGEGEDLQRQGTLRLKYTAQPTEESNGKFDVLEAELDPEIVRLNEKAGIPNPVLMGGEIHVRFACTYRKDYMPPITMAQNDAISPGRHLFMWIPAPSEESPNRGYQYNAEVIEAQVFPPQTQIS